MLLMPPQISMPFEVDSRSFFHSCVKYLCSCVSVKAGPYCPLGLDACQTSKSKMNIVDSLHHRMSGV